MKVNMDFESYWIVAAWLHAWRWVSASISSLRVGGFFFAVSVDVIAGSFVCPLVLVVVVCFNVFQFHGIIDQEYR